MTRKHKPWHSVINGTRLRFPAQVLITSEGAYPWHFVSSTGDKLLFFRWISHTSGRNSSDKIPNPYSIVLYTLPGKETVKKFLLFYGTRNLTSFLKCIQPTFCPELDESVYTLQIYYFLFILIAFSRPHLQIPSATFKLIFMTTIYSSLLKFPFLMFGQNTNSKAPYFAFFPVFSHSLSCDNILHSLHHAL